MIVKSRTRGAEELTEHIRHLGCEFNLALIEVHRAVYDVLNCESVSGRAKQMNERMYERKRRLDPLKGQRGQKKIEKLASYMGNDFTKMSSFCLDLPGWS